MASISAITVDSVVAERKGLEMRSTEPILLVEDDRVDAMTVKRALKELHVTNRLDIAENGEEALAFLRDPNNEKPGIILLDLNMPRMNGIEFLEVVKRDDRLRSIPVIVLTTSREEQDKVDSFNLGVAGAAWATLTSLMVTAVMMFYWLFIKKNTYGKY